MSKSRARLLAELLNSAGRVKKDKSDLAGADSIIDLDTLPTITNAKLENSSISIAGHSTALGGSVSLNTGDITEHTDYKYYTDARVRAAISVDGNSLSYNSSTGVITSNYEESPVFTGNLEIRKDDPTITLFNNSGANTDPNGTIIFSEVSGTTNFDINYNGSDDRLEFRGRVGNNDGTDLVYINRSSTTPLHVLGNITVTGTVDGRDIASDGSKLDGIESGATADQTQSEINALGITATGLSGTPNITVGTISSGAITSSGTIKNGSYTRILTGASNTGQITFNANWDGSGYVPDYSGASYAGMATIKMAGGGYGRIQVYTKNSGTTSTSQALSTFTKVAEFHDAGYFDASNGLRVGGLAFADTSRNITAGTISGALASSVTATTQSASDNSTKVATTAYVDSAVSGLVDSAPGTLNTLNELAAALGDDANFSTTVTNSIATKLPLAGGTITGRVTFPTGSSTKPILAEGFYARTTGDTSGTHDIWGVSGQFYPSASSTADQWGIQWSGTPNEINFIGAGQKKLSIDLDTAGLVKIDNNKVWHAGNDGASSGLDADLLDGQEGSYYLSANNFTGTLSNARLSSHVDIGGQLDIGVSSNYGTTTSADRLWISSFTTGQSDVPGNYYDIINLSSSSTHGIQIASGYGANSGLIYIRTRSDNNSAPAGTGLQAWNKIWHANNDGSGSGLDADTLDGYDSAENGASKILRSASNGYLQIQNWINIASTGLYSSTLGHHFYIDTNGYIARSGSTSQARIVLQTSDTTNRGAVYVNNSNQIGFLNNSLNWRLQVPASGDIYWHDGSGGSSNKIWHAGNDGSGTGLDADTVDGYGLEHMFRIKTYTSGYSSTSGQWYSIFSISENTTPVYVTLKNGAHSTATFVVSTGYSGSNEADLTVLNSTWTQNGGYPGAQRVRVVKDSNGNYFVQVQLYWSSSSISGFSLYCKLWGGTPVSTLPSFVSSLSAETGSVTVIREARCDLDRMNFSTVPYVGDNLMWHAGNDGSGTGLDADTVDGVHASSFALRDANHHIDMNNYSITNLNDLSFNDPGPNEGIRWLSGNDWRIYESPDDLTTNTGGNLQFVTGTTRRMTIDTSGNTTISGSFLTPNTSANGLKSANGANYIFPLDAYNNMHIRSTTGSEYHDSTAYYFRKVDQSNIVTITASNTNIALGSLTRASNTVWDAGNDGSGSGLDADLLDGYHLSGSSSVATKIFNNKGQTHSTVTNFNTSMTPGPNYVQGYTNGPENSGQWYGFMLGLGSEYGTTTGSSGHYASQMYYKRNASNNANYLYMRSMEGGNWQSWLKVSAGYADSAGSATNADTVDNLHASSFLRSNADDEYGSTTSSQYLRFNTNSGQYIASGGSNSRFPLQIYAPTANGGDAAITFHISGDYAGYFGLASDWNDLAWGGWSVGSTTKYRIWHSGNDGSGTGLDADTLDGVQGSSFLRSDADDTWSGNISTTSSNGIRFGSSNQSDSNDGYIAAGRFSTGLNIVGTQTSSGTGRQIRFWGELIRDNSSKIWHADNDGSGSGLDADTVDGYQFTNHEGVGDYEVFLVNGDTDKYYPVVITGGAGHSSDFKIWRGYNEYGPDDWNTSTHKGGLTFRYRISGSSGWGGYPNRIKVLEAEEIYSTILGGINYTAHTMKHVVWLRGGGTNGARYHISSTSPFSLAIYTDTSSGYTSGSGWASYSHSNTSYNTYVDYRTLTQRNAAMEGEIYNTMSVNYGDGKVRHVLAGTGPAKTYFTTSNDGSGSGFDADLLDGQHGSYYAAASSVPTNNNQLTNGAGYITTSGTANQSNMVSGSAFSTSAAPDSVLEYAQASGVTDTKVAPDGSWYNSIRMGHGDPYTYYSNTIAVKMTGSNVGNLYTQTISNNNAQGWNKHWHDRNDGSGSGLDADLLDGVQGSSYLRSDTNQTFTGDLTIDGSSGWNSGNGMLNVGGTGDARIQVRHIWGKSASSAGTDDLWLQYANSGQHVQVGGPGSSGNNLYVAGTIYANGYFTGNRVLTTADEGSGQGLDADTVDGVQVSSLLRSDTGDTITNNVTITQRGQFTTGTSGQNNSAQAGTLSYSYGYQFGGAWSSPFPDLVMGYHTGMRFGGHTSYGGCRFYADHPSRTTTMLFSIGNGDSHVRANNNLYAYTSDIRLKENFRPIENAVEKVKSLGGYIFDWREDMIEKHEFQPDQPKDDAGLIAQDVQKVMPAAIKRAPFDFDLTKPNQSKSGEEFLTVQYEKMVPLLIQAIKEQQEQIDELKKLLEDKE